MGGDTRTMLERPRSRSVSLGGVPHALGEIRPCDIPAVLDLVERLGKGPGLEAVAGGALGLLKGEGLNSGAVKALSQFQPKAACEMLASLLDPDPMSADAGWRESKARELMTLPLSELTRAIGAWIELNSSFFGQMALPLILGCAEVLEEVNKEVARLAKGQEKAFLKAGSA